MDETDREEYIGVKMGLLGIGGTPLIPEITQIDDEEKAIRFSENKDRVKDAPTYKNDEDVTDEFEGRIRGYYRLESSLQASDRGSYAVAGGGASRGAQGGVAREEGDRSEGGEGPSFGGEDRDYEASAGDTERRGSEPRGEGESEEVPVRRTDEGSERGGGEELEPRGEGEYGGMFSGYSDEESFEQEGGLRTRIRRRSRSQERFSEQEEEEEHFGS